MADPTYTPNYNLTLPAQGATGWGVYMNQNLTELDNLMKTLTDLINDNLAPGSIVITSFVTRVNGQTDEVELVAEDVGAIPIEGADTYLLPILGTMLTTERLKEFGVVTDVALESRIALITLSGLGGVTEDQVTESIETYMSSTAFELAVEAGVETFLESDDGKALIDNMIDERLRTHGLIS
jgi:hypothetical protein